MIGFMGNLPLTPPPDEPGTGGGSGLAGLMKARNLSEPPCHPSSPPELVFADLASPRWSEPHNTETTGIPVAQMAMRWPADCIRSLKNYISRKGCP